MRKAVVRNTDGFVVNIIEIKFPNNWQPPKDCYCIDAGDGSPGDTWDGAKFVTEIPTIYRYETFTKEITHPKRDTPIYVGYEVLEFNQELTATEIADLETQLGKTVRKLE